MVAVSMMSAISMSRSPATRTLVRSGARTRLSAALSRRVRQPRHDAVERPAIHDAVARDARQPRVGNRRLSICELADGMGVAVEREEASRPQGTRRQRVIQMDTMQSAGANSRRSRMYASLAVKSTQMFPAIPVRMTRLVGRKRPDRPGEAFAVRRMVYS